MRTLKKAALGIVVIASIPVLFYLGVLIFFMLLSPLSCKEMDLDKDGWVSLAEADYTGSYGSRSVNKGGESCIEYFALKDGLALKVVCGGK